MSEVRIEKFDTTGVSGFVDRKTGDTTISLRLVSGSEVVSECNADLFRPDAVGRKLSGHPYCGFILPIPTDYRQQGDVDVVIDGKQIVASGKQLQTTTFNAQRLSARTILKVCDHSFKGINGWSVRNGICSIHGVLLPPNGRYAKLKCIGQKDVSFMFHWPIYNETTNDFYWYYPGSPYLSFRIDINLAECKNNEAYYKFYFVIEGEDISRSKMRNIAVPKDLNAYQNIPDDFNVKRVQSLSSTIGATIAGFSDYKTIIEIASRHITLGPQTRFLDWGCGFGRVCRHIFSDFPRSTVTGVELDEVNLGWMRENLPLIRGVKTSLDAKIDLADSSVDLIYGISVMTHMREAIQNDWLRELKRILTPDGIMILTTAGAGSFAFSSRWLNEENLRQWESTGFLEIEHGTKFDTDIGGGGYYVQATQSIENTRRRWGQIAEIIEIIPSVFGYQDAVVMR